MASHTHDRRHAHAHGDGPHGDGPHGDGPHGDGPHGDGHRHPPQPDTEDSPVSHHQVMSLALGDLLLEKGVISAGELRAKIEEIDGKNPELGARIVARAWADAGYKERLLKDVNAAAKELDIDAGEIPIVAVENTDSLHNVVVCTLCSCYPRQLIGLPPDWYKSRAYRSRAVREPRAVLAEFGTDLPDSVAVRVHDSTADLRYLVLPKRPGGTDGMSEGALARLVTRDSLIGVSLPWAPGT